MADSGEGRLLDGNSGQCEQASAIRPSTVRLPESPAQDVQTIFDYFLHRFPRIGRLIWEERFSNGKVWAKGELIDADTPYRPLLDVHYRREVEREPPVRKDFRVVWSDQNLLVVDKPPNLPVTPGGPWVRNCLLHLLLEATGNQNIVPLHRLDRLTSGLVLLSVDPTTRGHLGGLFQPKPLLEKTYTAVCELQRDLPSERMFLAHHITRCPQEYWRQIVMPEMPINSRCEVKILSVEGNLVLLQVRPSTGRKHQIRVQLAHEGLPILGDPLYGSVRLNDPEDLSLRLWLDAYQLSIDAFPGLPGADVLTGEWTSSRPPTEFFKRATCWSASEMGSS